LKKQFQTVEKLAADGFLTILGGEQMKKIFGGGLV